jgi:hypothetical protein
MCCSEMPAQIAIRFGIDALDELRREANRFVVLHLDEFFKNTTVGFWRQVSLIQLSTQ